MSLNKLSLVRFAICLLGIVSALEAYDTTITISGSASASAMGSNVIFSGTGTSTLTGFGNGVFSATGPLPTLLSGMETPPITGTFKLDFSNGNTLTGTLSLPYGILVPTSKSTITASGSLTVTGATGSLEGTTGSFPMVTGSGTPTSLFSSTFQLMGAGTLNLGPLAAPVPSISGVLNSASGDTRLSPGCLATISGSNLAGKSMNLQVGGKSAAVINSSASSLSIQLPVDAPTGPASLIENRDGFNSNPANLTLDAVAPAIFPLANAANGIGTFLHANGSAVTTANPAAPQETIQAVAACLGPTNPQLGTGAMAPATPPVPTVSMPTVSVASKAANVTASVAMPNTVGSYAVSFTVPAGTGTGNQPVVLSLQGKSSNTVQLPVGPPLPSISAIVNAGGFGSSGTIAPGEFATLFGANLGSQDNVSLFPATDFSGLSITFNGTPAPLFSVIASAGQINLLTPSDLPTTGSVNVVVKSSLGSGQAFAVKMTAAVPGIFLLPDPADPNHHNAAALFANTAWRVMPQALATAYGLPSQCRSTGVNAASLCGESATAGDNIEVFVSGLGKAAPGGDPNGTPIGTGVVAPADGSVIYATVQQPTVTIGSVPATVQFSGIAPGTAGLYQVNIAIPAGTPTGDAVPITITMPNGASDTAAIPIR